MTTTSRVAASRPMQAPAPTRRLAQFAAVCVILSWLPWIGLGMAHADIGRGVGQLVFGLAASGPSLAALVMWLRFRPERIRGTGHPSWYAPIVGLLLGAAAPLLTALILHAGSLSSIGANVATVAAGVGGPLGVIAYTLVSGPLSEEFGWRGYVQPRLRQRFTPIRTALILGVTWACWHIPLFFLPGTGQHAIGLFSVGGLAFFGTIIAFTYVILFVTEYLRGGVWAAVALHAGFNCADSLMPANDAAGSLLELMIMVCCAVAVGLIWRARRPTM